MKEQKSAVSNSVWLKVGKFATLGHILQGPKYEMLELLMRGDIEGKRGQRSKEDCRNVKKWSGIYESKPFSVELQTEVWKYVESSTSVMMIGHKNKKKNTKIFELKMIITEASRKNVIVRIREMLGAVNLKLDA